MATSLSRVFAGQPELTGFDVFAIEAESVPALHELADHCQRLAVAHDGVHGRGDWGAYLDIPDPDGTVVRILANNPISGDRFLGWRRVRTASWSSTTPRD
jgi:hypothetical protein